MLRKPIKFGFTLGLIALFVCGLPRTGSTEESQTIKTRYFDIQLMSDVDADQFVQHTGISDYVAVQMPTTESDQFAAGLDRMLDQAAEVLGLNMHDFDCRVEIFATDAALKKKLDGIFGIKEGEKAVYFHREYPAFYFHEKNTIYLSMETATVGVIGHEMTHALISRYFVVPPTERIQEILAGYVEYSLKKSLR